MVFIKWIKMNSVACGYIKAIACTGAVGHVMTVNLFPGFSSINSLIAAGVTCIANIGIAGEPPQDQ